MCVCFFVSLCPIHNMERGRIQTGRFVCVCDTRKGSGWCVRRNRTYTSLLYIATPFFLRTEALKQRKYANICPHLTRTGEWGGTSAGLGSSGSQRNVPLWEENPIEINFSIKALENRGELWGFIVSPATCRSVRGDLLNPQDRTVCIKVSLRVELS